MSSNTYNVLSFIPLTGDCLKHPKRNVWLIIRREVHFSGHTFQMFDGLSGHVVEINNMPNGVQKREEQSRAGSYFMELHV